MSIEHKSLNLEIKEINEKGVFEGIACKYGNVDHADDRLLKSAGARNNNKEVPILYQHDTYEIIGKGTLTDGIDGIMLKATLFLDKDEKENAIFPLAEKGYELAKKGLLKLSIGYIVKEREYKTEDNRFIRELKDIEVLEVSMVTFPCNEQAVITDVKGNTNTNLSAEVDKLKNDMQEIKSMLQGNKPNEQNEPEQEEIKKLINKIDVKDIKLIEELKGILDKKIPDKQEKENNDIIIEGKNLENIENILKSLKGE